MSPPLWHLEDVRFAVPGREILAQLSLSLAPGRVYGLIGPNGSGKSTLLKLLARQVSSTGGTIAFEGKPLARWHDRDFARAVAYMPQFTPATDGMSVRELVALGRFPWHGTLGRFTAEDAAKVERAIARTDLAALAGRTVDSLSGGERQRAWVALMLAQDPRCLLLDEPTSALDIAHQSEVLDLVRRLSRESGAATGASDGGPGMAVVVVLHDINLAMRTCDELIALRGGRVLEHGPARELMRPDLLAALYGLPMGVLTHPVRDEPLGYVL
ncbi:ATP-binding cassette domain-containing protein [Azorhizobium doebereinerae]|uniref:ABC transporter ATP-binding protein n=1 Tax=Azorhizobium doebereinerae TaxID=281091 RepID=UPI00048C1AF0